MVLSFSLATLRVVFATRCKLLGNLLNAVDIVPNCVDNGIKASLNSRILLVKAAIFILSRDCATLGNLPKAFTTEFNPVGLPKFDKGCIAALNLSTPEKSVPLSECIAELILPICLPMDDDIRILPTFFNFSRLSANFDILSKPLPSISFRVLLIFFNWFETADNPMPPCNAVFSFDKEVESASMPLTAEDELELISTSNCSIVVAILSLPFLYLFISL